MKNEINVLALVKGEERYVFLYDNKSCSETLRTVAKFASKTDLSFTWYDAAVVGQKIRQEAKGPVEQSGTMELTEEELTELASEPFNVELPEKSLPPAPHIPDHLNHRTNFKIKD